MLLPACLPPPRLLLLLLLLLLAVVAAAAGEDHTRRRPRSCEKLLTVFNIPTCKTPQCCPRPQALARRRSASPHRRQIRRPPAVQLHCIMAVQLHCIMAVQLHCIVAHGRGVAEWRRGKGETEPRQRQQAAYWLPRGWHCTGRKRGRRGEVRCCRRALPARPPHQSARSGGVAVEDPRFHPWLNLWVVLVPKIACRQAGQEGG